MHKHDLRRLLAGTLLCLTLLFPGCLDPIDLDTPRGTEDALVIQAELIYGDPARVEVRLNQLYNFSLTSINPAFASEVLLEDEQGNQFELRFAGDGLFRSSIPLDDPRISIAFDKRYRIIVRALNNRTLISDYEPLLRVPRIDSIAYQEIEKFVATPVDPGTSVLEDYVEFRVSTSLEMENQNERARLRWRFGRTYQLTDLGLQTPDPQICYIFSELDVFRPTIYDGNEGNAAYLTDYAVYDRSINWEFNEGFYLSLYQESLSEGAFRYWNQIQQVLLREGNMFEAPPGRLTTNFYNPNDPDDRIYGYFYATQRDTSHLYISPDLVGNPEILYCEGFIGDPEIPTLCEDCLQETNSQLTPPPFWDLE
jgi:hypothetical protein